MLIVVSSRRPVFSRLLGILVVFAMACADPVSAYGVLGHQTIAAIAEDMLTPKAKAEVGKILGPSGGSLVSVSTWADEIRMLRPETRPWHYITIQIGEPHYDPARADSANVVKALKRELAILSKPYADRYVREEALKWVVHLTGDLHQPLHVGEDHDKGGNLAKVKVNRRTYNLHEVWDYVLLERLHLPLDSLRGMLEKEIASSPGFIQRNASGTVEAWADETHSKAARCYLLRGKPIRKGIKIQLDRDYVNAATLTALEQLKIGGVRLAFALNRALDPESKTAVVAPMAKPPVGWRDDKGAFFAQADEIKEAAGAEDAEGAPKAKRGKASAPSIGKTGGQAVKYAWSVNSGIYHFSECADVARIKKKNLCGGNAPPPGMRLHAGCPVGL